MALVLVLREQPCANGTGFLVWVTFFGTHSKNVEKLDLLDATPLLMRVSIGGYLRYFRLTCEKTSLSRVQFFSTAADLALSARFGPETGR